MSKSPCPHQAFRDRCDSLFVALIVTVPLLCPVGCRRPHRGLSRRLIPSASVSYNPLHEADWGADFKHPNKYIDGELLRLRRAAIEGYQEIGPGQLPARVEATCRFGIYMRWRSSRNFARHFFHRAATETPDVVRHEYSDAKEFVGGQSNCDFVHWETRNYCLLGVHERRIPENESERDRVQRLARELFVFDSEDPATLGVSIHWTFEPIPSDGATVHAYATSTLSSPEWASFWNRRVDAWVLGDSIFFMLQKNHSSEHPGPIGDDRHWYDGDGDAKW
jgi:hypothetical protein